MDATCWCIEMPLSPLESANTHTALDSSTRMAKLIRQKAHVIIPDSGFSEMQQLARRVRWPRLAESVYTHRSGICSSVCFSCMCILKQIHQRLHRRGSRMPGPSGRRRKIFALNWNRKSSVEIASKLIAIFYSRRPC